MVDTAASRVARDETKHRLVHLKKGAVELPRQIPTSRTSLSHFLVGGFRIRWLICVVACLVVGSLPGVLVRASEPPESGRATGTGFFVGNSGHVLTNHHVVEGCSRVEGDVAGSKQVLNIVASDQLNDLAVLSGAESITDGAVFRDGRSIRPGDEVFIVGYPMQSILSGVSITTGIVSSLTGLSSNTSQMQISAPVQPGNSGSPALDKYGNVVGVVVAKLDAVKVATRTGDIPQNINFAINGTIVKTFLDAHNISYEMRRTSKVLTGAEIAAQANGYTLPIRCLRGTLSDKVDSELVMEKLHHVAAIKVMDDLYPTWRTIINHPAYQKWLANQREDYQKLMATTWNPRVVYDSITSFDKDIRRYVEESKNKSAQSKLDEMLKRLKIPPMERPPSP